MTAAPAISFARRLARRHALALCGVAAVAIVGALTAALALQPPSAGDIWAALAIDGLALVAAGAARTLVVSCGARRTRSLREARP